MDIQTRPSSRPVFLPVFQVVLVALGAFLISAAGVRGAPFASMVMDARNGEIILAENAQARLHPASLTKMMTLYLAFEAIETGEIDPDAIVTITERAAREPASKIGLEAGQEISFRNLVRAAAIASANDAATAIAEALGGEDVFVARMNRTGRAMGMTRTTFKNATGLTEDGHLSTAHDMTRLGRRLLFDFPEYYDIFSRLSDDAGVATVRHTNRRFLESYEGADGIKTGYTQAAGFNLTASVARDGKRLIATVFGAKSTSDRNETMAELMDFGFRAADARVAIVPPEPLPWRRDTEPAVAATEPTELGISFADLAQRRQRSNAALDADRQIAMQMPSGAQAALQEAPVADEPATRNAPAADDVLHDHYETPTTTVTAGAPAPGPTPTFEAGFHAVDIPSRDVVFDLDASQQGVGLRASPGWRRTGITPPARSSMIHVGTFESTSAANDQLAMIGADVAALGAAGRAVIPSDQGMEALFMGVPVDVAAAVCDRLKQNGSICSVSQ